MNRSIPAVIALALSTAAQAQEVHSPQDGAASAEITCQAGVYLLEKGGSSSAGYVSIAESLMQHRKVTGMIGFALTGGLAGMKIKSVLPGALAKVRTIQKRPEFRFCFERPAASDDSAQSGSTYVGQSKAAFSPGDFRLFLPHRECVLESRRLDRHAVDRLDTRNVNGAGRLRGQVLALQRCERLVLPCRDFRGGRTFAHRIAVGNQSAV